MIMMMMVMMKIYLHDLMEVEDEDLDNANSNNNSSNSSSSNKKKKEKKYPEQVHHNAQYHYAAVRHILLHLKHKYKDELNIKKLTFFTDGSTNQYRNKNNVSRMLKIAQEFNVDIIIHGFAGTACFKGSHDAFGG